MRLESLCSLINAELCSNPTIHTFSGIVVKPSKVVRGDLYIALNASQADIDLAIENGAYGIVYDLPLIIADDEIAWLKVSSVKEAELKLLRFHLMSKNLRAFYANSFTTSYIKMLKTASDFIIIEEELDHVLMKLWNAKEHQIIVIREQNNLTTLFPTAKLIRSVDNFISIYPVTPFESDITIEHYQHKRQKLPRALALYFSQAVSFLDEQHIPYTLSNLVYPKSCEIVSCDRSLNIRDFGQGVKTLIFIQSKDHIEDFTRSFDDLTPWISYTVFMEENEKNLGYNNALMYSDKEDCIRGLKENHFDYAIVVGQDKTLLDLVPKPLQQSLF